MPVGWRDIVQFSDCQEQAALPMMQVFLKFLHTQFNSPPVVSHQIIMEKDLNVLMDQSFKRTLKVAMRGKHCQYEPQH